MQPWYQQQNAQMQQYVHRVNQRMLDDSRRGQQQHQEMMRRGQEIARHAAAVGQYDNAPRSTAKTIIAVVIWLAAMAFVIGAIITLDDSRLNAPGSSY